MTYLPPGPILTPDGVAGMTIVVGPFLLVAFGLVLAFAVAALGIVMLVGRQSPRRGARRWPAVALLARGGLTVRRAGGDAR